MKDFFKLKVDSSNIAKALAFALLVSLGIAFAYAIISVFHIFFLMADIFLTKGTLEKNAILCSSCTKF